MINRWLSNFLPPALIFIVGTVVAVAGFRILTQQEASDVQIEIEREVNTYTKFLRDALKSVEGELASVAGLFTATGGVSVSEFRSFVRPILLRHPETWAITWVAHVPASEKQAFEQAARAEVYAEYEIRERDGAGRIIPATARSDYFPILYTESLEIADNTSAWGVDPMTDAARRGAFLQALDTGQVSVTGGIKPLAAAFGDELTVATIQAIYHSGHAATTAEERQAAIKGFVVGLFRVSRLVETSLAGLSPRGLDIYLYDADAGAQNKLFYYHASRTRAEATRPLTEEAVRSGLHIVRELNTAGRPWIAIFRPAPGYFTSDSWLPLLALSGVMLLTLVLALYQHTLLAQHARISSQVARQTKELARREARFQTVFEAINTGIIVLDADSTIQIFNPAAEKIFGYTSDEIVGRSVLRLMSLQDQTRHKQRIQCLLNGADVKEIETDLEVTAVRKNGETFPARLSVSELVDVDRKTLVGTITDVTGHKRASLLLEGRAQVMSLIAEGEPLAATLNALCEITEEANPGMRCSVLLLDKAGACLQHGAAPSLPDYYNEAIDGAAIGPATGSCGTAAFTGEQVIVENVLTHPFWVDYRELAIKVGFLACWSQPFFSEAGKVLGIFAVYLDEERGPTRDELDLILKQASLATIAVEKAEAKQKLVDSEQRFRQIAETIDDVFLVLSADLQQVHYVSPAYEKIWGRSCQSCLDNPQSWMEAVHPDDREAVEASQKDIINGIEDRGTEFRIVRPDGAIRRIRRHTYPVRDATGKVVRTIGIAEDITESTLLAKQLRQSQKLQAVGQLTGGVAHDFNNLLAIIEGNLSLLESDLAGGGDLSPEHVREFIEPALEAGRRGADLTHRLLAFSRKQALDPTALDINSVIKGMEKLLKRTLREDIDLSFRLQRANWLAEADASELENVLLNLILNARDAMLGGGKLTIETAEITLSDEYTSSHAEVMPGDYVMLAVSDTGTGMDADTLERVFEPFFTTKETGKGTGLGLSMVYGFARQSKGHVEIYSEPGEGTTVKLYLPRAAVTETAVAALANDHDTGRVGGNETILVVEDDAAVRRITTRILAHQGYTVLEAADGKTALDILHDDRQISLLLTDVVLPGGMNGPELVKAVPTRERILKILYMSGYTENAILHHGRLEAGVNLISKPFSRARLGAKVREILDAPA